MQAKRRPGKVKSGQSSHRLDCRGDEGMRVGVDVEGEDEGVYNSKIRGNIIAYHGFLSPSELSVCAEGLQLSGGLLELA